MVARTLVLMLLSRLLLPEDFGVLTAAMVVIGFVEPVSHLGIGPAITQRSDLTVAHVRTAFSFSTLVGVVLCVMSPAYMPLVAALFNMPEMESTLYAISLLFPIRGVGLVAESLMNRELRFREITRIEIVSYSLGYAALGVTLAFLGFGSWALVLGTLTQSTLRSVLLLFYQPHPKTPKFDRQAFKDLLLFGGGFTLARIGNALALQGDNFVIGRWLGATALGLYGRAYQLMVTPATLFGAVMDRVLFPAMAKVQGERSRLARSYERGVALVSILALPTSVLLYVLAPEVIQTLLGEGWDDAIAPFRVLVFGTLFRTSYKISDSLARGTGAVYQRAWRQFLYAFCVFAGSFLGQHWGLEGVAVGVTVALSVNFIMMAGLSLKLTGLSWRQFIAVHIPSLSLALLVGLVAVPIASLVRAQQVGALSIIVIVLIAALGTVIISASLMPGIFLGAAGTWGRDVLLSSVRRWFFRTDIRTPENG